MQDWSFGPSFATSLKPLTHCQNVSKLSLFYRYYFGKCSSELAQLVPLPFSRRRSICYSDRSNDFSVNIPNITRMSTSPVSFLTQLHASIKPISLDSKYCSTIIEFWNVTREASNKVNSCILCLEKSSKATRWSQILFGERSRRPESKFHK